jgi:alpha-L-rhamnosidase
MTEEDIPRGLALFTRFDLVNGETLRTGSGPSWKTRLQPQGEWYMLRYDDNAWDAACAAAVTHQPWPPQPAMQLRREFTLDQPAVKARLYATALGAYEARLNGRRVGDALLTPELSQYPRRALYRVYEVTGMLQPGANVLGLIVGDGWYASFDDRFAFAPPPRRVLAQLEIILADGSRQVVGSGPGWRGSPSAIRDSQIRVGETYDARLEQPGWDTANFDAASWVGADIAGTPGCSVVAQTSAPIRATQTLAPCAIRQPRAGVYVFDFGQCFAGWCRLHVKGPRGTRIEMKFAELLAPSGAVEQPYLNIGWPKKDIFILKGDAAEETFEPHFTFRGFRYVEVTGLPAVPSSETLEGIVVHSDLQVTGRLRCGAALIEQIWRAIVWSRRSNFMGIPTDTPSREQRGFTASAGICWEDAAFNMDVGAFTSRVMDNIVDEQSADGAFPEQAPRPHSNNAYNFMPGTPPGWGDGGIILPWIAWRHYGTLSIIEKNWEAMNRHVQFIFDNNPDYLWKNKRGQDYGDWLALDTLKSHRDLPSTPKELIGTAYWAHSADLLAQMARAIGRTGDAERLHVMFVRVCRAFNDAFVKADGTVGSGSQSGYVLALRFGLLPSGVTHKAAARLAKDVRDRGVSLTTGILGTQFILDVLSEAGFTDLAYGLLLRREFPSWGYMIDQGATTIWESWNGERLGRNHSDLASISSFLFRRVAGIDAATSGFETIAIRPVPDARVKSGGGDYDSVMGRISTDWERHGDGSFSLNVKIPANASARIHVPTSSVERIQESRQGIIGRSGLRVIERSAHEVVLGVGSGYYEFLVEH